MENAQLIINACLRHCSFQLTLMSELRFRLHSHPIGHRVFAPPQTSYAQPAYGKQRINGAASQVNPQYVSAPDNNLVCNSRKLVSNLTECHSLSVSATSPSIAISLPIRLRFHSRILNCCSFYWMKFSLKLILTGAYGNRWEEIVSAYFCAFVVDIKRRRKEMKSK